MILLRDHHYLAICNQCDWYRYTKRAPFAAMRYAKRHSANALGHKSSVIDLQRMEPVTGYVFYAIPQEEDDPPF